MKPFTCNKKANFKNDKIDNLYGHRWYLQNDIEPGMNYISVFKRAQSLLDYSELIIMLWHEVCSGAALSAVHTLLGT